MIELKDVEKIYEGDRIETVALAKINLEISNGEFVSVMGPSGSGKSTLLNIMGLLDVPSGGSVILDRQRIEDQGIGELSQIRNRIIGFIFQTFHLISDLNVFDNVEIPLLYRRVPGKLRREMVTNALERVGLASRMRHFPSQLSGGQQQRAAIARAIVGNPKLLLADEPTGNLDSEMGQEIMRILQELNRENGTTIVMVTHDPGLAKQTGRTIRIFDGRQVN